MYDLLSILTLMGFLWAITALLYQWYTAWGGGRRDFSKQSGKPIRGLIYNLTIAMLPSHKETVRLHPLKFLAGIMMHIGVFTAVLSTIVLMHIPDPSGPLSYIAAICLIFGLVAACYLLIRRITSPLLRKISSPDDHFAIIFSTAYIALSLLMHTGDLGRTTFLVFSIIYLLYFPLGKLRHALFFFVARADYGLRLGYRGLYPVSRKNHKERDPE
jgi:nitrate reductase gamma subunit